MMFSRISVLFLLFFSPHLSCGFKWCSKTCREAEKCAKAVLFLGAKQSVIPEKASDVIKYCMHQNASINCMESYAPKCYPKEPNSLEILRLSTISLRSGLEMRCNSKKAMETFYQDMRCIDSKSSQPINECVDRLVASLRFVKRCGSLVDDFAGICCSLNLFKGCIYGALRNECEYASHPKTFDTINRVVSKQIMSVLDIDCKRYETTKLCYDNASVVTRCSRKKFMSKTVRPQERLLRCANIQGQCILTELYKSFTRMKSVAKLTLN